MNSPLRILLLAVCASICVAGLSRADGDEDDPIYYCEDANGGVLIQTDPCPAPEPEPEAPPPPPPPKPKPEPKPEAPRPPVRKAAITVGTRMATWTLVPRTDTPRTLRDLGPQRFSTSIAEAAPRTAPTYRTPERTWLAFLDAIARDDHDAATACLTPAAKSDLELSDESPALAELRTMVQGFSRIVNVGDLGPYWAIYGVREGRRPKWIFFEELAQGEWKISGI
jgi:hypothetical protein